MPSTLPKMLPRLRDWDRLFSESLGVVSTAAAVLATGVSLSLTVLLIGSSVALGGLEVDFDPFLGVSPATTGPAGNWLSATSKSVTLWKRNLTELAQMILVTFTSDNSFTGALGLGDLGFNNYQPAITLSPRRSLESVPVAVDFEREVVKFFLCDIGSVALKRRAESGSNYEGK